MIIFKLTLFFYAEYWTDFQHSSIPMSPCVMSLKPLAFGIRFGESGLEKKLNRVEK